MIFHAKSLLGTEKVITTKICQFQFHTAFAASELGSNSQLKFSKNDLDGLDSLDKYPESFHVLLSLDYKNIEAPQTSEEPWHNRNEFDSQISHAPQHILFNNQDEMSHMIKTFDIAQKIYTDDSAPSPKHQATPNINIQETDDSKLPNYPSDNEGYEYLNVNEGQAGYSPSSGSGSPMPPAREGNLLDFDDFGSDTQTQTTSLQEKNQENKLANDFELLLDLGATNEPVTKQNNDSPLFNDQFKSKNSNLDSLLNFDSFEPNLAPKVNSNPQSRPSSTSNLMFDPFGKFDIPSGASNNKPINNNNTRLGFSSNNSSNSNLNQANTKSNDPFADLAAFAPQNTSQPLKQNSSAPKLANNPPKQPSPTQETNSFNPNYTNKPNYYGGAFTATNTSNSTTNTNTTASAAKPGVGNSFNFMTSGESAAPNRRIYLTIYYRIVILIKIKTGKT